MADPGIGEKVIERLLMRVFGQGKKAMRIATEGTELRHRDHGAMH
jgi:hypothetical protein